ncbi:hypothetical protein QBC41DRAFT_298941 [Cercophora samala]|uniref:Uncharacterized protein n=1 Tax=Cercophora samala TaxID=330535 RepID=A0AA39ZLW4_9PEZI|nr:hypothetical protein QBC41DRAFT_298941 [Cercophora samala]
MLESDETCALCCPTGFELDPGNLIFNLPPACTHLQSTGWFTYASCPSRGAIDGTLSMLTVSATPSTWYGAGITLSLMSKSHAPIVQLVWRDVDLPPSTTPSLGETSVTSTETSQQSEEATSSTAIQTSSSDSGLRAKGSSSTTIPSDDLASSSKISSESTSSKTGPDTLSSTLTFTQDTTLSTLTVATAAPPEASPTFSQSPAGSTNQQLIGLTVGPAVGGTFILVAFFSFCFCCYIRPRRQRKREARAGSLPADENAAHGQKPELDTAVSGVQANEAIKKELNSDRSPTELTAFSPPTELNNTSPPIELTSETRPTELRVRTPTSLRYELETSPVSPVDRQGMV